MASRDRTSASHKCRPLFASAMAMGDMAGSRSRLVCWSCSSTLCHRPKWAIRRNERDRVASLAAGALATPGAWYYARPSRRRRWPDVLASVKARCSYVVSGRYRRLATPELSRASAGCAPRVRRGSAHRPR